MQLRTRIGLISLGLGVMAYGCSDPATPPPSTADAGSTEDASVNDAGRRPDTRDGGATEAGKSDAPTGCDPDPAVQNFTPPPYKPVLQASGSCAESLIQDYATHCLNGSPTAQCRAVWLSNPDQVHKTCLACLVTPGAAAKYGAIISTDGVITANIGGCLEKRDTDGGVACATAMQAAFACTHAACDVNCSGLAFEEWQQCTRASEATGGVCEQTVQGGDCYQQYPAGSPGAECSSGQTFVELAVAAARAICGTDPVDAGPDAASGDASDDASGGDASEDAALDARDEAAASDANDDGADGGTD